jgi:hypothetical protein
MIRPDDREKACHASGLDRDEISYSRQRKATATVLALAAMHQRRISTMMKVAAAVAALVTNVTAKEELIRRRDLHEALGWRTSDETDVYLISFVRLPEWFQLTLRFIDVIAIL